MKNYQEIDEFRVFLGLCVTCLAKGYAEALAEQANFTTMGWMWVYQHCSDRVRNPKRSFSWIPRCYNMQKIALRKAVATASTQEDWESIKLFARPGKQRKLAHDKLMALYCVKAE